MRRAVAVLLVLLSGCPTSDRRGRDVPPKQRVFAYAEVEPEFIDPALIGETAGGRVAEQLFEPLMTVPLGDGAPIPGQAARYRVSADGRVYTFELRRGLRWSDGTPLDARDFLYAWRRALAPATRSRAASQFYLIKGARAFNRGDNRDPASVGVSAPDRYTLRVELVAPAPYFLDLVTRAPFSPTPRHVIARHGAKWTRPPNIVSNGPFALTEWKTRERMILRRNPHYRARDKVWLERVEVHFVENESVAFRWYERGKVNWTPGMVPVEKVPILLRQGRRDFHIDPWICTYYYAFNVTRPPFDDVRVRRAFNMAIDKGKLTRQVLGAGQRPATHLIPPALSKLRAVKPQRGDAFDPVRARALLREAGYRIEAGKSGKPFPVVTLLYNTFEAHRLLAEFVQRSLKNNLGVTLEIGNMEWKTLLKRLRAGDYHIARSGWCADYPDPQDYLEVFETGSTNNYPRFSSAAFDHLVERLRREGDPAHRKHLTEAGELLLSRQQPILPIYFYSKPYMLSPFVRGFKPQLQDRHVLSTVRFAAKAKR
ncbi:MAG: peptide ABC transporter substrate-binding protein [Myxococcales bacterium]|nr:peptide ABC transporter substrate-binding protein [Myxococcales bacterium]